MVRATRLQRPPCGMFHKQAGAWPRPLAVPRRLEVVPIVGIKRVEETDDVGRLIADALRGQGTQVLDADIVVVTQKVVSKSEGRLVRLADVRPGRRALSLASELGKDPRVVQLVLSESRRVVRKGHGVLITETRHGFVCANAGIDASNVERGYAALLPRDPDESARAIRRTLERDTGRRLAVIVSDTFGRPWREGQTDLAIGCSGIAPTVSLAGSTDPFGYTLRVTEPAVVDEVAGAAELVMGKTSLTPAALVRGVEYARGDSGVRGMLRDKRTDLFR